MIQQEIKILRREGLSYREICRKLNLSYSTVQRTCFGVKMSKVGMIRHSALNGLTKQIKFKKGLNEAKVRVISNLLFDGAVYISNGYHYSMMYVNSSKEMIMQFTSDMQEVYHVEPSGFEETETYQRVKYNSKIIYEDLMRYFQSYSTSNKKCSIPDDIINGPKSFKIILMRAFWENEGSISASGRLVADLKSLKVIRQLSKLHNEFGLKHNITRYTEPTGFMYKLFLSKTKENYQRFMNLELFSKAMITKGFNKGKKKVGVLKIATNRLGGCV